MAAGKDHRAPHEIIEAKRAAYLDALPPPDPDWPPDVRIVYEDLLDHLFDLDFLMQDVYRRCGCLNHNISCRFKHFVGRAPKAHVVYHRVALAKRLLYTSDNGIAQIALSLGCGSPSAFTKMFKKRVGVTPSRYRGNARKSSSVKEKAVIAPTTYTLGKC